MKAVKYDTYAEAESLKQPSEKTVYDLASKKYINIKVRR